MGGTVGNPTGAANIQAANGTILDEPFDRLEGKATLADQLISVPSAFVQSGSSRVDLKAEFQHPRDSFTTGHLHAHVQSHGGGPARLRNLQKQRPNTAGTLQVNAEVSGTLQEHTEFLVTGVTGDASVHGLRFEGENYGDINANARTTGQTVNYNLTSDFAGSNIQLKGNTELTHEYPTTGGCQHPESSHRAGAGSGAAQGYSCERESVGNSAFFGNQRQSAGQRGSHARQSGPLR